MIKNNTRTTFLLTSILGMTLLLGLTVGQASATLVPAGCTGGNSGDQDFTLWRSVANGGGDVQSTPSPNGGFPGTVDIGETITLQTVLSQELGKCDFEQGTLAHLLPDGTVGTNAILVVSYITGVPVATTETLSDDYVISMADDAFNCNMGPGMDNDGILNMCSFYGQDNEVDAAPGTFVSADGISYSSGIPMQTNNISSQRDQFVTVNGDFTAFTLATPRNTVDPTDATSAPVNNPSDVVTINGVDDIPGTWAVTATLVTPDGNVAATCDAAAEVSTFPHNVNCSVNQSFSTPGDYCWNVTIDDNGFRYPTAPKDHTGTFANNECFRILPDFTVETDSTPNGLVPFANLPVTTASDTITIYGDNGFAGTFTAVAELWGPGPAKVADAVCADPVSSSGPSHIYPIEIICTVSPLDLDTDDSGLYYFDNVVVTETSGAYDPNTASPALPGIDDTREQFTISPPYTVTTWAEPWDIILDPRNNPVENPKDLVSIHGVDGIPGTFDVEAVLNGPSGPVDTPICPTVSSSAGDNHDYPITSLCETTGTGVLPAGHYNWVVTVTETGGEYPSEDVIHPDNDSTPLEIAYEHFFIPPTFTVDTDSFPNGPYDGEFPITMIMDTINIYGTNGFPGTFDVTGNFYGPDGIGGFMVLGVTTCDQVSSSAGDNHTYPITTKCNVAGVSIEETDVGLYYFADIQVTEVGPTLYDPSVEVPAIPGAQDPREQFTVAGFEGCTPGYWKQPQHFGNYPNPFYPGSTIGSEGFAPMHGHSATDTFVDALKYKGGKGLEGAEGILLRAAAAGWINTQVLTYGYVPVGVDLVADVNAAIASNDRQTMISLAGIIDGHNNPPEDYDEEEQGPWCPLGRAPGPLLPT